MYDILRRLKIPKVHYHADNSLPLDLYIPRTIEFTNYAIRFNLILSPVPLSPDRLTLSFSHSKSANIYELHSMVKRIQHQMKHRTVSLYSGQPVVFKCKCRGKECDYSLYRALLYMWKHLHVSAVQM